MGETLFRRNAVSSFKQTVIERSNLMKGVQTISGKSIQTRNPVWINITGECMACDSSGKLTVPFQKETWDELYGGSFRTSPILEKVSITYGGDFGMAQKLSVTIKCFDLNSFNKIRKHFLLPGNKIEVAFGYATDKRWNSDAAAYHKITGFKVATFSFSAGEDGTWIGNFVAVAPSEVLKGIDVAQGFPSNGLQYSVGGNIDSSDMKDVSSIPEVIISDAQRNGEFSVATINENTSGYLIGRFKGYTPTDESVMVARIAIYTQDHLRFFGIISSLAAWGSKGIRNFFGVWDEAKHGLHEIYVTLGYVVDRIVNDLIKNSVETSSKGDKDIQTLKNLKISFHKDWSKSKLPDGIESGDPTAILILGPGKANFTDDNGKKMDFNEFKAFENASYEDVKAWDGNFLRLDKILIHRDVIFGAMDDASKKIPPESESVDPKDSTDTVINLNDFFRQIFGTIEECTGGALKLRLIPDPNDDKRETLYVVDQNYGGDPKIDCFVFNPIDGDGNTRSCNISSNGGSNEYRTSMFLANSKKGDVAAHLRGCDEKLDDGRKDKVTDAKDEIKKLKTNPGLIVKNSFNGTDISTFKSAMVDLYRNSLKKDRKYENINWPGIELDLSINGAYGILPGCAVATTQIPDDWINKKIYFMVREVSHEFSNSDWVTNIRGLMSFHDNLNYIKL
jgi:hypothetical protein